MDANLAEIKQSLSVQTKTKWETVAESRWGDYISQVERRVLLKASELAETRESFLEVGCEGGRWSQLLSERGWLRATCTDVNPEALSLCQSRLSSARCVLMKPEDRHLPCEEGSVNLLVCIEVIPVVRSDWFPDEAVRVLADHGVLMGVFLNKHSLRGYPHHIASSARRKFDFYQTGYGEFKRRSQKSGLEFVHEEGLCWMPFRRDSNSSLVPLAVWLERSLGLHRLPEISPWIAFIAKKR